MKLLTFTLLILFSGVSFSQNSPSKLKLPSLIGDNMILQQKTNARLWGKTIPSQQVRITTGWKASGTTTADKSGKWQVTLPTPKAGGPYTITIAAKDSAITIKNVLIGEVWFCSGQSNMEMPLSGWPPKDTITHGLVEIAKANYPQVRLFNVTKTMSYEPEEDFAGRWEVCTPSSVKPFSATAFFFGKKLAGQLNVPVGLIESAWGGTPVESWISGEALADDNDFKKTIENQKSAKPKFQAFMNWLNEHPILQVPQLPDDKKWQNLDFNDAACALANFDDSSWPVMNLPKKIEDVAEIGEFDGAVWFRRTIDVPAQMTGKDLQLSLGPIDDMDRVYVNGVLVGEHEQPGFWQVDRMYTVPSNLAANGKITIAIRILDNQGGGGIWGKPEQMNLSIKGDSNGASVRLDGGWKYLPVAELVENKFYMYDVPRKGFFAQSRPQNLNPYTSAVLFNAMVNPAVKYSIKGAIWYQGEANVGRAAQYSRIFPLMINNWRKAWGIDFSFYFVQLAPWIYSGINGVELSELREAQMSALNLPNTGMAVTLDIGNVNNIHPTDKTDVGERLARLALNNDYKIKTPFSGPVYKSMKVDGNRIFLQFNFMEGGLVAKNGELKEFEIAGKDGQYYPAKAEIINNEVVVSSTLVNEPVSARYCWHNGSEASLFNKAGLPASVFRTAK